MMRLLHILESSVLVFSSPILVGASNFRGAYDVPTEDFVGVIRSATNPTKCLDVTVGNPNGDIRLWNCKSLKYPDGHVPNQQFIIPANGEGVVRWAESSDRCIEVTRGNTRDGTLLRLTACDVDSLNQQFQLPQGSAGTISWSRIEPASECWDILGPGYTSGALLRINGCTAKGRWEHQQFTITPSYPTSRSSLEAGERLYVNQDLMSDNGGAKLILKHDGNLMLYRVSDYTELWSSGTSGTSARFASMDSDGDLSVYGNHGRQYISTGTAGKSGIKLVVADSCRLEIVRSDWEVVWSTDTSCERP